MTASNGAAMFVPGEPPIAIDAAGNGPTLVFLHGIGGNRSNWAEQLAHFSPRFRAVAWDARGYGDSGGTVGDFYDFADDLARLIRHVGAPAHVVGLSMGGRIALAAWDRTPDLIASLTLADTSAGSAAVASPERVEAFLAARRKPLVEDGKAPADIAPDIVATIAGPNVTAAQRARLIDSHARLRADAYLATLAVVTRFTAFPDFAGVTLPVQVIVGAEDRVATPAYAAAMAARFPNARLAVLPGAGHVSNIEAPDAFNIVLDRFLRDVA